MNRMLADTLGMMNGTVAALIWLALILPVNLLLTNLGFKEEVGFWMTMCCAVFVSAIPVIVVFGPLAIMCEILKELRSLNQEKIT